MAKGGKREGAGRPKGAVSQKTLEFTELAEKHGVRPGEIMMRVAKGERIMALAYANKETGEFVEEHIMPTLDQMLMADKEITQYVYPKRKAIEHGGPDGGPIIQSWVMLPENERKRIEAEVNERYGGSLPQGADKVPM
jgi:hypothetical protein